jgi:hypothetical protein
MILPGVLSLAMLVPILNIAHFDQARQGCAK